MLSGRSRIAQRERAGREPSDCSRRHYGLRARMPDSIKLARFARPFPLSFTSSSGRESACVHAGPLSRSDRGRPRPSGSFSSHPRQDHAQKRVSVLLPDVVPRELALTELSSKWGIDSDDVGRQPRHVSAVTLAFLGQILEELDAGPSQMPSVPIQVHKRER